MAAAIANFRLSDDELGLLELIAKAVNNSTRISGLRALLPRPVFVEAVGCEMFENSRLDAVDALHNQREAVLAMVEVLSVQGATKRPVKPAGGDMVRIIPKTFSEQARMAFDSIDPVGAVCRLFIAYDKAMHNEPGYQIKEIDGDRVGSHKIWVIVSPDDTEKIIFEKIQFYLESRERK